MGSVYRTNLKYITLFCINFRIFTHYLWLKESNNILDKINDVSSDNLRQNVEPDYTNYIVLALEFAISCIVDCSRSN